LICGETVTVKELIVRANYHENDRKEQPFVTVHSKYLWLIRDFGAKLANIAIETGKSKINYCYFSLYPENQLQALCRFLDIPPKCRKNLIFLTVCGCFPTASVD